MSNHLTTAEQCQLAGGPVWDDALRSSQIRPESLKHEEQNGQEEERLTEPPLREPCFTNRYGHFSWSRTIRPNRGGNSNKRIVKEPQERAMPLYIYNAPV